MCSLVENGLWLMRYAGRPTPKMIKKKLEQKNGHKRKNYSTNQRGMLRKRKRERDVPRKKPINQNRKFTNTQTDRDKIHNNIHFGWQKSNKLI